MRNMWLLRVPKKILWLISPIILLPFVNSCFAQNSVSNTPVFQETYWYDGNIKKPLWFATDEVAIIHNNNSGDDIQALQEMLRKSVPGTSVLSELDSEIIHLAIPDVKSIDQLNNTIKALKQTLNVKNISRVFLQNNGTTKDWQLLSGELIIHFRPEWNESEIVKWLDDRNLNIIEEFSFAKNAYRVKQTDETRDSLEVANEIYEYDDVTFSYPNWIKNRTTREMPDTTHVN